MVTSPGVLPLCGCRFLELASAVSVSTFWTVNLPSVTLLIELDHEISTTATSYVPCSCISSGSNVVKCAREFSGKVVIDALETKLMVKVFRDDDCILPVLF